jgi:GNAT superfamily N-acetyltransferase
MPRADIGTSSPTDKVVELTPATTNAAIYSEWIRAIWGEQPLCLWLEAVDESNSQTVIYSAGIVDRETGTLLAGGSLVHADMHDRPLMDPWLACLIVAPPARRMGRGTRLVEHLVSFSEKHLNTHLYLFCDPSLVSLYARLGFEPIEARTYENHPSVIMKR